MIATDCPVVAQSIQGSILGSVKDQTGAAVPNATVKITDTDTGTSRTVVSNSAGDYQLLNIPADHYKVEVTAHGFESQVLSNLTLNARQQLRADATLTVGAVDQQVTVDASNAGVIATETASVDSTLSSVAVRDLPANYRASTSGTSPISIIQAMPGVQTVGTSYSIQGGLPFQTEFSVDGVTIQGANNNSPQANSMPSGDSISELRVDGVLNNAEFGQPGEVTSITKGGTNHLHGSLFWYHQESAFNATPFGSLTKPHVVTNDFGISAGGPVVIPHLYNGHDKTFFFATYEGYRSPRATPYQSSVPTAAMKKGDFSGVDGVKTLNNPFTGGTYPNYTVPINEQAQKFLQFFPDPNIGDPNIYVPGANNFSANKDNSLFSNQFDVRGDQYLGKKALIFGRYTWKNSNQSSVQPLLVPSSSNITQNRVFVGAFNYTFTSNIVNEFRFGATLQNNGNSNPFDGKAFTDSTGLVGLQNLFYNGLSELDFANLTNLDPDRLSSITKSRTFVYTDSLSWIKGHHTMKFGVDLRHIEAVTPLGFSGADNYGTFDYSSAQFTGQEFADFLIGAPSSTFYDVVQADNDGLTMHYHAYAQDQWKVTPRLTLSYGVRWEFHPAYHDPSGNIGNFDPSVPKSGRVIYPTGKESLVSIPYINSFNSCGIGQSSGVPAQNGAPCTPTLSNTQAGLPDGLRTSSKTRFMPRFGFALRLFNDDKTTLRGGFGMYNITLLGSNFYSLTGTLQAYTVQYNNNPTPTGPTYVWPNIFAGSGNNSNAASYGQAYFGTANDVNWKDPYAEQTSLSIDRDLGHGYGARISYIGMTSRHLVWAPNLNDMPYSSTVSAYNQPLSARPFPNWGVIQTRSTGADSNYQSLQVEVTHHLSKGLMLDSTYTLAKNVSNNQGPHNDSFAGESGGSRASYAGDANVDFGEVYGTRRHRWNTTMVWEIPVGRGRQFGNKMNRLVDAAIGGWQISNILLVQTGSHLSPYFSSGQGDPSGTGSGLSSGLYGSLGGRNQLTDHAPGVSSVPSGQTRYNWVNKAAFVCPGDPTWQAGNPCHTGGGQTRKVVTNGVTTFVPDPLPIGRFGNAQNGSVLGPGTFNLSTGVNKSFKITETVSLRAEGTFTNVINHTNLGNPNMNITSGQFGVITGTNNADFGGNRSGQVSMRLEF
ncbi:MAG: collagen-binding protein [Acidobacteriales bacterium 59-55]|nr:carboxypeptidase regulatory-like domain-containing protein [Terriglobales bacterium]OJV39816.1 MAG: collagen-binding protein [Acidobacteriales bacterium 59-55]